MHDACRCDGTGKTIPGWEYQFTAAVGHLRTAWAALIDVGRVLRVRVMPEVMEVADPVCPADGAVIAVGATGVCRSVHAADANLVALPASVDFVAAACLGCRFATAFR